MRGLQRAWPWIGGGLALALANAWLIVGNVYQFDESWTLQVVHRLAGGDALYGDVHFGVTPLSIYVLWAAAAVAGEQILVVKALSALLAAGSALLVARIARQAGVSGFGAIVCAVLTLPLAPAFSLALYTPLAMLLFLACESVALTASERRSGMLVAAAGGAAGLSFAAKQNVGGLALLALVAALFGAEPTRAGVRRSLVALASFSVVASATLGAMVATGGVERTLDALGLAKGAYLDRGAVAYHDVLPAQLRTLARPGAWRDVLLGRDRDLLLVAPRTILPVAAVLLLGAAWIAWRRRSRTRSGVDPSLAIVTVFAGASFAAAYPRYESVHLAWVAGPLVVAAAVALTRVLPPAGPSVRGGLVVLAGAWAAFALLGPVEDWRTGEQVRVGLPHFAGAWTSREQRDRARLAVRRLQAELPDRRVFIATGNASFYYLGAGLENPTRFDFPASTTMGRREIDEVLAAVAEGSVPVACLVEGESEVGAFRPLELERRLRQVLRRGPDVGLCRLWLGRGASLEP